MTPDKNASKLGYIPGIGAPDEGVSLADWYDGVAKALRWVYFDVVMDPRERVKIEAKFIQVYDQRRSGFDAVPNKTSTTSERDIT